MNSKCEYCAQGDTPKIIDGNGVLSSVSGESGILQHAYEDSFWLCQNVIKTHDEYNDWMAECERLIDLDPEPDSQEGKWFQCVMAIIQEYEKRTGKQ